MKTVTQGCLFTIQKVHSEIKNKNFLKIKIGKSMKGLVQKNIEKFNEITIDGILR